MASTRVLWAALGLNYLPDVDMASGCGYRWSVIKDFLARIDESERNIYLVPRGTMRAEPSAKEVRWWWRIHLALPEICEDDVYYVASAFAFREAEHDILGNTLILGDLEALMAWRPWESDEQNQSYYQGLKDGIMAAVPQRPPVRTGDLGRNRDRSSAFLNLSMGANVWPDEEHPHKLPSQLKD